MKKILICCSKRFYNRIAEIKEKSDERFEVLLSNTYGDESAESRFIEMDKEEHRKFKSEMFRESLEKIEKSDRWRFGED